MCCENKGADQLRDYREADLRLCFRICKKPVFSRRGSIALRNLYDSSERIKNTFLFLPNYMLLPIFSIIVLLFNLIEEEKIAKNKFFSIVKNKKEFVNQRTNGPVNAHLISGPIRFLKVFTINRHGDHLGHVTCTICINFLSLSPRRLHTKFGFDWPRGFRADV